MDIRIDYTIKVEGKSRKVSFYKTYQNAQMMPHKGDCIGDEFFGAGSNLSCES